MLLAPLLGGFDGAVVGAGYNGVWAVIIPNDVSASVRD